MSDLEKNYQKPNKRFEIDDVSDEGGYKTLVLKENGLWHSVIAFPTFSEYEKLLKGNWVDGYIRISKNHFYTLVDYKKPERNWLLGERFI